MTKLTENTVTFSGKSGKNYTFELYKIDTNFNTVGAIYIFTQRAKTNDGSYEHTNIYCGKTDDLSTRFNNHHKATCINKNDANCICILLEDNEKNRTTIEEDILKGNSFPCNEVLN